MHINLKPWLFIGESQMQYGEYDIIINNYPLRQLSMVDFLKDNFYDNQNKS